MGMNQGEEESNANRPSSARKIDDNESRHSSQISQDDEKISKRHKVEKNDEGENDDLLEGSTHKELEERKQNFLKTIRAKNWTNLIFNIVVGLLFIAYFIQVITYQKYFKGNLQNLQDTVPLFFDRFRYTMLGYAFLRERIINNNTLQSFEFDPVYGHYLDNKFNDDSIENEISLTALKTNYPTIVSSLVDLLMLTDSELFCNNVVGEVDSSTKNTGSAYPPVNVTSTVKPYQS